MGWSRSDGNGDAVEVGCDVITAYANVPTGTDAVALARAVLAAGDVDADIAERRPTDDPRH